MLLSLNNVKTKVISGKKKPYRGKSMYCTTSNSPENQSDNVRVSQFRFDEVK